MVVVHSWPTRRQEKRILSLSRPPTSFASFYYIWALSPQDGPSTFRACLSLSFSLGGFDRHIQRCALLSWLILI